jgi:hypothetical protein
MGRLHVLFVSEIDRADQSIQQCREDVFYMNIRFLFSAQKIVGRGTATSVLGSAALIGVKGVRAVVCLRKKSRSDYGGHFGH